MVVQKRDGTKVPYEEKKISDAISKACAEVGYSDLCLATEVAKSVTKSLTDMDNALKSWSGVEFVAEVEFIQDMVEHGILLYKAPEVTRQQIDVALAYAKYRQTHKMIRDRYSEIMSEVGKKLRAEDVANQNANVDEKSMGGRTGEATDIVTRAYARDNIISEMSRKNHEENRIYIHDFNSYAVGSHNCLSIPFDKLLAKGFNTRQTDVRPAQSVSTAFQLVAVIFQIQSLQQFGGVSATHLDWTMVPYVRKSFAKHYRDGLKYMSGQCWVRMEDSRSDSSIVDGKHYKDSRAWNYALDMTYREVCQAVEGMYHNLNTLQSRSGNQLPFTSINYGTCTLPEGRMVIEALLNTCIKGIGKLHKTSVFPCGIFQSWKGVNRYPGDPNYDLYQLALKSTATRMYPNYANVDWSGNAGFDPNDPKTYFSTMGCRTANGWDINGMGQTKDGRGNICPVTIILPTIAMEALEDFNKHYSIPDSATALYKMNYRFDLFMHHLYDAICQAREMLKERFDYICSQPPEAAGFMYENGTMEGYVPEEGIRSALKHGTLAIGQLGLAECLQILVGCDHTTERGMRYAKQIEQMFKDLCVQFKEEDKLNYGVYYTPAENLCYTAMKKFKAKYGEIPNVSDRDFFTNSMHVPVWKKMDPFKKIDIESQLTGYSSAGCITYVELDSSVKNNLEGLETIVTYAMEHDIPYFAVNVPNDTCLKCGFCGEIDNECPVCGGKEILKYRRVTGYLSTDYRNFNKGKQEEVESRVKHTGTYKES